MLLDLEHWASLPVAYASLANAHSSPCQCIPFLLDACRCLWENCSFRECLHVHILLCFHPLWDAHERALSVRLQPTILKMPATDLHLDNDIHLHLSAWPLFALVLLLIVALPLVYTVLLDPSHGDTNTSPWADCLELIALLACLKLTNEHCISCWPPLSSSLPVGPLKLIVTILSYWIYLLSYLIWRRLELLLTVTSLWILLSLSTWMPFSLPFTLSISTILACFPTMLCHVCPPVLSLPITFTILNA